MEQAITIMAKIYPGENKPPRMVECSKVYPDDAKYIERNGFKLSMEFLMTGETAIYLDDGTYIDDDPDEDPLEIIVLARGRSCEDCIKEAVELSKKRLQKRTQQEPSDHG